MSSAWPDPAAAAALHQRLRDLDPLAPSDFAAAFVDPVLEHLRRKYPRVDEHLVLTAAEDAVLSVIRNPGVFDPARAELGTFLGMAAVGDLRNALQRELRHADRRDNRDCVEVAAADGNDSADDADGLPSFDDPDVAAAVAGFTDAERRVLELMKAGERATAAAAAALGITGLPPDAQAREVKRVKERIFKRLRRVREGP